MMERINLNALAARVHKANQKLWVSLETGEPIERNKFELLMLMQAAVAEGEIADVVIRALDYAGGFDIYLYDAAAEFAGEDWSTLAHWRKFRPESNRGEVLFEINRLINDVANDRPTPQIISRVIAGCRIYCKLFGYDLWGAFEQKIAFNETRKDTR